MEREDRSKTIRAAKLDPFISTTKIQSQLQLDDFYKILASMRWTLPPEETLVSIINRKKQKKKHIRKIFTYGKM